MTDDVTLAWAYLSRVVEPPCPELSALATRVGPVEAAERVRRGAAGESIDRRAEARRHIDCAASDLDILTRLGGRLVTRDDEEWPWLAFTGFGGVSDRLRAQAHPPMVLWAVGPAALDEVAYRAAAIVGTRAATAYGEFVAADLAAGVAGRDVAVVSGGAYGIDGAAHRAALAADGLTVAVLAGGIDVPYPAGHTGLLRRIAEQGLVCSEYPPGVRPARHRFLTRNRLVAALGGATVVVEAGARSGAANTAAWACALGRPVCAVPGPVTSSASVGCHVLLRGGAQIVTRAADLVELVGSIGELAPEEQRAVSPLDDLTETEKRIYDALPRRGGRTADEIAVTSGLPARQVLGPLANLELSGLVVCRDGRWKLASR
ncbi:DNA-protecting protein DprA [Mycolicibacterium sp. GF69]|uniref:DNA-processing protein DprA n=1 Tax=Mycolicibacterium sp. GF69 TaxID=2267251 RepID=UPI000DCEF022|nr:DNA-processing protein DprA [Mycolicibacterium sp. GF69]RAV10338.1 DNA-protecting protein DprA [Mycolicibacterium sp. GF69]